MLRELVQGKLVCAFEGFLLFINKKQKREPEKLRWTRLGKKLYERILLPARVDKKLRL